MSIAEKLKKARKERGLSQDKVARQADVPFRSYCEWESGRYKPRPETLLKLARFYGKPVEYFIDDDQPA